MNDLRVVTLFSRGCAGGACGCDEGSDATSPSVLDDGQFRMAHLDQRRRASFVTLQYGAVADADRSVVLLRGRRGSLGKAHRDGRDGSAGAGRAGDYQGSSRLWRSAVSGCSVADAISAYTAGPHHRLRRHYHGRVTIWLLNKGSRSPVQIDQSRGWSLNDCLAVYETRMLYGGCVQIHLGWVAAGRNGAVLRRDNELSARRQSIAIQYGHRLSHCCRCLNDSGCAILCCNAPIGCLHDHFTIGYGRAILECLWLLPTSCINDEYGRLDGHARRATDGRGWRDLGKRRGGDS